MYWLAVWCWFAATMVGVALFSGRIFRWQVVDQIVAVGVLFVRRRRRRHGRQRAREDT